MLDPRKEASARSFTLRDTKRRGVTRYRPYPGHLRSKLRPALIDRKAVGVALRVLLAAFGVHHDIRAQLLRLQFA
jgi:hypothetical protein